LNYAGIGRKDWIVLRVSIWLEMNGWEGSDPTDLRARAQYYSKKGKKYTNMIPGTAPEQAQALTPENKESPESVCIPPPGALPVIGEPDRGKAMPPASPLVRHSNRAVPPENCAPRKR